MRRLKRILTIVLSTLVGFVAVALAAAFGVSEFHLRKNHQIGGAQLSIPADASTRQ